MHLSVSWLLREEVRVVELFLNVHMWYVWKCSAFGCAVAAGRGGESCWAVLERVYMLLSFA